MENALLVAYQIIVMFLLMAIGFALQKFNFFSEKTVKELNNFVIYIVISAAIIDAFNFEYSSEMVANLGTACVLAVIAHAVGIVMSKVFFGSKTHTNRIASFACMYSNCGFMALPLLSSVFGSVGVFYGSAYIAIFNIFIWCHGAYVVSDKPPLPIKQKLTAIVTNPVIISVFLGILLYITNIRFPAPVQDVISYVASLNTPFAMIMVGIFVGKCNVFEAFKSAKIYMICLAKLFIMPVSMIFILKALSSFVTIDNALMLCIIISSSCPTAGTVAMLSERADVDTSFGVKSSTITTLLSVISIPTVILIAQAIL